MNNSLHWAYNVLYDYPIYAYLPVIIILLIIYTSTYFFRKNKQEINGIETLGIIVVCLALLMPLIVFLNSKILYESYFKVSSEVTSIDAFSHFTSLLGVSGDFFGGTTVGLLTLGSIIFLISTLNLQRKSLETQRKELEQNNLLNEIKTDEDTFFTLLSLFANYRLNKDLSKLIEIEQSFLLTKLDLKKAVLDEKLYDTYGMFVLNKTYETPKIENNIREIEEEFKMIEHMPYKERLRALLYFYSRLFRNNVFNFKFDLVKRYIDGEMAIYIKVTPLKLQWEIPEFSPDINKDINEKLDSFINVLKEYKDAVNEFNKDKAKYGTSILLIDHLLKAYEEYNISINEFINEFNSNEILFLQFKTLLMHVNDFYIRYENEIIKGKKNRYCIQYKKYINVIKRQLTTYEKKQFYTFYKNTGENEAIFLMENEEIINEVS